MGDIFARALRSLARANDDLSKGYDSALMRAERRESLRAANYSAGGTPNPGQRFRFELCPGKMLAVGSR